MIYMARAVSVLLLGVFATACFPETSIAQSPSEQDAPVPNQGAIVDRLQAAYDQTGDVSIAYHLARISLGRSDYDATSRWLRLLAEAGWKMGLNLASFSANTLPKALQKQIAELNLASEISVRSSGHALTFQDPLLMPESIAYDAKYNTVYAGSLLKPRLVKVTQKNDAPTSENVEIVLPEGVDWGVLYGIKFNNDRGDLWLLNNRTTKEGMKGNLSVIARDGSLVKSYQFAGEPAVELNDLCFSAGYVYATDSTASRIYRGAIDSEILEIFYQHGDISFPNGIACNDTSSAVYVADFRGVSRIKQDSLGEHERLKMAEGFSLGGIDGMYLWNDNLVGVQNYLGALKIVMVDLGASVSSNAIDFFDVNHPNFRIPTTGFINGDCLFYIANSSLDALNGDGSLNTNSPYPSPARVHGLHLKKAGEACKL